MNSFNDPRKSRLVIALVVFVFSSLACNLLRPKITLPQETIPVTTQAVEDLKEEIQAVATQAKATGQATLVIDETELTSLVTFELQKQETKVIQQPQVFLRDGQMQIAASIVQGEASVPVQIIVTVEVDSAGQIMLQIVSAAIGPVALPEDLVTQFSKQLDQVFEQNVRPRMGDVTIQSITIADGKMTIQGTTQ